MNDRYAVVNMIISILIFFTIGIFTYSAVKESDSESSLGTVSLGNCNTIRIPIYGYIGPYPADLINNAKDLKDDAIIYTSSIDILHNIRVATNNLNIKSIVVDINSYGGDPVASEEIANAISRFPKSKVAVIRSAGTSGGYMAALGADKIFASKYSSVGSIGVTASYSENAEKNSKEGVVFNSLIAGKYKDMGNPDKPLTEEEKKLIQKDLDKELRFFVTDVARMRNLKIENVEKLANGASMLAYEAKEKGLIDEIGSFDEAKKYLETKMNDKVTICEN